MSTVTTQPSVDQTAVEATVAAVTAQRELGQVTFTMRSQSTGRLTAKTQTGPLTQAGVPDESRLGKFTLHSDEPLGLLGTDTAVSPAEFLLKSLAGCYTATLAFLAAARDITLDEVRLTLGFETDLSGFLGIDETVRKGANKVTVDVEIDSVSTSREQLEELVKALEATSPIRDTIANPVVVTTRLV
ncbi:putative OsmC-like protein [Pseudarthrobacter sp. PvP004]|uniref:OsmC family protein n=1 Tax=Pseudarthrobacter sp. PvP004 TaxID=2817850 RepID=UPI001AE1DCD2|nr:OsmC family protein [Pseudarthrobacter sp. PvP004]MBP2266364.1 putative OsmC-like protein [Pseudarthrobacter sp. PvP004]